jgi:hypothetical protein
VVAIAAVGLCAGLLLLATTSIAAPSGALLAAVGVVGSVGAVALVLRQAVLRQAVFRQSSGR